MTDIDTLFSKMTPAQQVAFAILCAAEVYHDPQWTAWAEAWLSGEDRSKKRSAAAAESAASRQLWATDTDTWATARAAEWAAMAAAEWAARGSAKLAAWSAVARAAAKVIPTIDLPALARQAMKVK